MDFEDLHRRGTWKIESDQITSVCNQNNCSWRPTNKISFVKSFSSLWINSIKSYLLDCGIFYNICCVNGLCIFAVVLQVLPWVGTTARGSLCDELQTYCPVVPAWKRWQGFSNPVSCLLCKKVCRYLLEGVSVILFIRAQLQALALCRVSLVGLWVMVLCWLVREEAIWG